MPASIPHDRADPASWSLAHAASALRDGRISAQHGAQALLARATAQGHLNAFTRLDAHSLIAQARAADAALARGAGAGLLHGLPIALKDNIATRLWPTTAGTAALRHWVPGDDAEVVRRLAQAGALLAGKTAMHELAMGWTGQNAAYGDTRQPHDPRRMAGGSSGGSACAVAAGLVAGAIGTDTNGSLRVPASFCGIVALRPTHGRYPMAGVVPLAPSLDTLGPMARSVSDVALLDAVMAGAATALPWQPAAPPPATLRLGICRDWFWERLDDDVAHAAHQALARLRCAGVECVPVALPQLPALVEGAAATVIRHEAAPALAAFLRERPGAPTLDEVLRGAGSDIAPALAASLASRDAGAYHAAMDRRAQLRRLWTAAMAQQGIDALVHPAVRVTAPVIAMPRVSPGPPVPTRWGWMAAREAFAQNVTPAALVGAPSLVLPVRDPALPLPVGLQFDGLPGEDRRLLAVGAALEQVLG